MKVIEAIARAELAQAFAGLRIRFTDRSQAPHRIRVVQRLRDLRIRGDIEVAGESRSIRGFGGSSAVNFQLIASYAEALAPPDVDRPAIVEAIGKGIGRSAVHELAHQLLGASLGNDARPSHYEYESANRLEQYYGELQWGSAWPLLEQRLRHSEKGSGAF